MPKLIPSRVRTIREAMDKPLAHISRKAGLSARNLLRIESDLSDKRSVNDNTIQNLAKALRVDIEVLTGELPMPENLVDNGNLDSQKTNSRKPSIEIVETRLVKIDDEFVIVEFNTTHPTGRVIARNIVDEAAGLRLSAASALRSKLTELYRMLAHPDGFFEGFAEEMMNRDNFFDPDDEDGLERYVAELGGVLEENQPNHQIFRFNFDKLDFTAKADSNGTEEL